MWVKAGASLAVLLTLCAGLWFVRSKLDKLEATQARLAQVEQMLSQSRNELQAERLARKLDGRRHPRQTRSKTRGGSICRNSNGRF